MDRDIKSKASNIWYYYKYYILAAILGVIVLIISVKSCSDKAKYDVNILFMTHGYSESFYDTDELSRAFNLLSDDINGDGIKSTQVITINYGSTLKESNAANSIRTANLAAGMNVVFLLDEQNYNELKTAGFLADLETVCQSKYTTGDRFDVVKSGMFSDMSGFGIKGQNYYLCLRKYDEAKAKKNKDYVLKYNAATALFENIAQKYK